MSAAVPIMAVGGAVSLILCLLAAWGLSHGRPWRDRYEPFALVLAANASGMMIGAALSFGVMP